MEHIESFEIGDYIIKIYKKANSLLALLGGLVLLIAMFGYTYPLTLKYASLLVVCILILLIIRSKTVRNRLLNYKHLNTSLVIISLLGCMFFGYQLKHVNAAERLYNNILETKIEGELFKQKNRFQYDTKLLKKLCLDGVYNRPLTTENNKYFTQKSLDPFHIKILSFEEYQSMMEKEYSYLIYNVQDNINAPSNALDDIYVVTDSSDKSTGKRLPKTISNLLLLRDGTQKKNIYIIEQSDFKRFLEEDNPNLRKENLENIELPSVLINHPNEVMSKINSEKLIEENKNNPEYDGYFDLYTYSYTILKDSYKDLTGLDYDKDHTSSYNALEHFINLVKKEFFE